MRASEESFRAFARTQTTQLRRSAYLLCGDWHLAEDLVQNTLVKLYRAWWRVNENTAVRYARKTLMRVWLDERRRPWRRVERRHGAVPERAHSENDPAVLGQRGVTRDLVLNALSGLPSRQRAVLVLRYWEDLPVSDGRRDHAVLRGNRQEPGIQGTAQPPDRNRGTRSRASRGRGRRDSVMDEQLLRERMTAAVDGEPPLGLDPERAADEAIRRHKRRRATLGSGVATMAVVGVVAVLPGGTGSEGGQSLVPAASSTGSGGPESGADRPGERRIEQLAQHAVDRVSELLPQARDVRVHEAKFVNRSEDLPRHVSITVALADAEGPGRVEVDIFPEDDSDGVTLEKGDSFELRLGDGGDDSGGPGAGETPKTQRSADGSPTTSRVVLRREDRSAVRVATAVPESASRDERMRESPVMPRQRMSRLAADPQFRLDR